jgi:hypothetical protein
MALVPYRRGNPVTAFRPGGAVQVPRALVIALPSRS